MEQKLVQVIDEFYLKTNDADETFLVQRASSNVVFSQLFSSHQCFQVAAKVIKDSFEICSKILQTSSTTKISSHLQVVSVLFGAFHSGLVRCCPDKNSQLEFCRFAAPFLLKIFDSASSNSFEEILTCELKRNNHDQEFKNYFSFVLQSIRASICEIWNSSVSDVNSQEIGRAKEFVMIVQQLGIVLKKFQKLGRQFESCSNSNNTNKISHQNGFVEVLLAQFQAATQITLDSV